MDPPRATHRTPGFRAALADLKGAQKPGAGVPAYTRWVNRAAGRVLAAGAVAVGLSPTAVTLISGGISLGALVALVTLPPTQLLCTAVVLGLLVAYALDSADGQVARLTGSSSRQGEWLDHVVDAARLPAFHLAVGVALVRGLGMPSWAGGLAAGFALLSSVWFFAQILASQMTASRVVAGPAAEQGASGSPRPRAVPDWVSFAKLPSDIGTLYLLVLVLPWTSVFLMGYLGLLLYSVVMAAAALVRRYRELGDMDRMSAAPHRGLP